MDTIKEIIANHDNESILFLIIDEITYVDKWDRGIKFAADAGLFENVIVMLTGSDLTLMQAAKMTFPGRRGQADKVDFHIHSLSFYEFLKLKNSVTNLAQISQGQLQPEPEIIKIIYHEFNNYLMHGGYLTAINSLAIHNKINIASLKTYSDWLRGDILKKGKSEKYLQEILFAILKRYNKQITWNNISDTISIDSHKTVADYCELLAIMDAIFIQGALIEDKLLGAPKKARKVTFTDPFIFHAVNNLFTKAQDPNTIINEAISSPTISSDLVEAIVSNHFNRYYETYYIKSEGEIDVAYVNANKFYPIEVKWHNQIRPKDIKQLKKYKNSKIFSKISKPGEIEGIPIIPLPLALIRPPFDKIVF